MYKTRENRDVSNNRKLDCLLNSKKASKLCIKSRDPSKWPIRMQKMCPCIFSDEFLECYVCAWYRTPPAGATVSSTDCRNDAAVRGDASLRQRCPTGNDRCQVRTEMHWFAADTWRDDSVIITLERRHNVVLTWYWRYYYDMCPLGWYPVIVELEIQLWGSFMFLVSRISNIFRVCSWRPIDNKSS